MKQPELEAQISEVIGEGKAAIKEYVQWWWVNQWDKKVKKEVTETGDKVGFDQVIKQSPNASDIEILQNALNDWKQNKKRPRKK